MTGLSTLASWDLFFFYGQNDLDLEIESDLMMLLLQPARSLYYDRQDSAQIANRRNYPNDLHLQVQLRFDIAQAVARKNTVVVNGSIMNGVPTKDRRIAVSQNSINFNSDDRGNLDVEVLFLPYYNYTKYNTMKMPMGV